MAGFNPHLQMRKLGPRGGVTLEAIRVGGRTELGQDSKAMQNLGETLPGPRLLELELRAPN